VDEVFAQQLHVYVIVVDLLLGKDQNGHLSERVVNMNLRLVHDVLPGFKQVFHFLVLLRLDGDVGRLFLHSQSYKVSEVLQHVLTFVFLPAKINAKSTLQNGSGSLTLG
jgi:hypothetical protein